MANTTEPTNTDYPVYGAAVAVAVGSIIIIALILPPMMWHFRNRNFGATVLVAWFVLLNLFNFFNATIWPTDDLSNWYHGAGLCDVEVKLQVAAWAGCAAAQACILRSLARVLDTDRVSIGRTKAQRRRDTIVEVVWMGITPVLQAIAHYIVQPNRYDILGISGCAPTLSYNWVALVTEYVPALFWTLVDAWYCVIIIIRLHKYKTGFASILASSGTTKSRFVRLFLICVVWLCGSVPLQCWIFYMNIRVFLSAGLDHYSWSKVHGGDWQQVILVPSQGRVLYDRLIWMGCGILIFMFFGMGKDAMIMYKAGLSSIGLVTCFPSLRADHRPSARTSTSSFNSLSSKAKLLFKRKSAASSWQAKSISSEVTCTTTIISEPEMPCNLQTVRFDARGPTLPISNPPTVCSIREVASNPADTMPWKSIILHPFVLFGRWAGRLRSDQWLRANGTQDADRYHDLELQNSSLGSDQTRGGRLDSTLQRERLEVHIQKEVIQGKE